MRRIFGQTSSKMFMCAVISILVGLCAAYGDYHSIDLPIKSYHKGLKVIRTPSHEEKHIAQVKVPPIEMPVHITFLSKTSPVHVDQKHKSTKGSYKKSKSVDETHKLVHEVVKPVYQEIKEVIKPYRKVVQVIEPVKEERLTMVHKSDHKDNYDNGQHNGQHNGQYDNGQHNGQHNGQYDNGQYKGEYGQSQNKYQHNYNEKKIMYAQGALKDISMDEEYLYKS